ncbi:MAG: class I SAM-dependent methyltransferase [Planctomycetes bacterium]|nr:class I SAM-dependent methyltransferase [Planctomycetota bacterium]
MQPERFSAIAHSSHAYCNPIGTDVIERFIALADTPRRSEALDIGCGKAELLIRLAETRGIRGTGIERSFLFGAEATRAVTGRGVGGFVSIRLGDASELLPTLAKASYDLVICMGSSQAVGGAVGLLSIAASLVRSGGHVLWGEGFWAKPPAPDYLAALGASADEMTTHGGNVSAAVGAGFTPLLAYTATPREWDEYEWAYYRNVENYVCTHPDDPESAAMLARARSWRNLVLAHGRETMGFGLYLLAAPHAGTPSNAL